ncbi:MAG: hypothetical protein R3F20_02440 [Planctomycetota bacterium]
MQIHSPRLIALAIASLALAAAGCGSIRFEEPVDPLEQLEAPPPDHRPTQLEIQALVMGMADDYGASLGEAVYLAVRSESADAKARWLAQSFLRNGMGAAIDIGASSNPTVAMLDLLVLSSLQSWAFEKHWIPAGIGESGHEAAARLREAERELWEASEHVLTADQHETLRGLIAEWIESHPDRTVVSLVRFDEFTALRRTPTVNVEAASGLLADVEAATAAVEDATLLGERILWFAGRLPYILGQQAELTAYRMADQPEAALAREALEEMDRLVASITARLDTIDEDLSAQQRELFDRVAVARAEALEDLGTRLRAERTAAIDQVFDRFAGERSALFDELEARQKEVLPVMTELNSIIESSIELTGSLTRMVETLDRVVARFDRDPDDVGEPLDIKDVAVTASEAAKAAEKLTVLLERANEAIDSPNWDRRVARLDGAAVGIVDHAFKRGLMLIGALIAGLVVLRLIPRRSARGDRD